MSPTAWRLTPKRWSPPTGAQRVFAAVKHFPGLGSASQSTEDGPANVGLSARGAARRDLVPFRAAFEAGAPGVVVGHGLYAVDDFVTPASLSRQVTTDLLRRRLRFKGIAITDDLADPPITALGSVPDAAVAAVKAGADMLYVSGPGRGAAGRLCGGAARGAQRARSSGGASTRRWAGSCPSSATTGWSSRRALERAAAAQG